MGKIKLGDKVKIILSGKVGRVSASKIEVGINLYNVAVTTNGFTKANWCRENQITKINE